MYLVEPYLEYTSALVVSWCPEKRKRFDYGTYIKYGESGFAEQVFEMSERQDIRSTYRISKPTSL